MAEHPVSSLPDLIIIKLLSHITDFHNFTFNFESGLFDILPRSTPLLNYNMIDDMVWISQDLKALIFAEA